VFTESGNTSLRLHVPSLKVSVAASPSPWEAEGDVEVWREQGEVCAYGYVAAGGNWMHLPDVATFRLGTEVVAFPLASATPEIVRDAFERSVLPMALQALGGEALHASGVLGPSGAVALCGDSGAGKSTLACAVSARGYALWADDAVSFEVATDGVVAVPLPFRMKLRPDLAAVIGDCRVAGSSGRPPAALAAAVILRRDGARPVSVVPLEGGEAFEAALEQGYCYRPSDTERRKGMVDAYLELVARIPVIEVRFEPGWEHLDVLVDALEEIVSRP
jgi:hypothetical protein